MPKGKGATWTKLGNLAHAPPNPRVWGGGQTRAAPQGSPSPYIKAALLLSFPHPFIPSSSPLLSLALAPVVWSWLGRLEVLEVLPPFGRRRAGGFLVRSFLLPLPLLDRSPEDVCTPYVYKTAEVPWFRYFIIVELFVYSTLRSASLRLLHQRSCGT